MAQQLPICDLCGGKMHQKCATCGQPACYNCGRVGMIQYRVLCPGHKDQHEYRKRQAKEAKRYRK